MTTAVRTGNPQATANLTQRAGSLPLWLLCAAMLSLSVGQAAQAKENVSASVDFGNIKIHIGERYRTKPQQTYNYAGRQFSKADYERYRRDCAEYLRAYGTGKTCHFPAQFSPQPSQVTIVQRPIIVVNNHNSHQVTQSSVSQHHQTQYSRTGFREIRGTQNSLPAGWSANLQRGDILDAHLYEQGRVVFRSPRGIVRIKLGGTTIQLKEQSREIISVIQR